MFRKLIELIREALEKLTKQDNTTYGINMYTISDEMQDSIELWKDMYKDDAFWLSENDGLFSLALPKTICQTLTTQVLSEMESYILAPDQTTPSDEDDVNTRASFLNMEYTNHILSKLTEKVEVAMAMGGMVIKPYVSNNEIYADFCRQGTFIPIAFDDEGNITDIAFPDQFTSDGFIYTKIERHTFDSEAKTVTVINKAYKTTQDQTGNDEQRELGKEIPLDTVGRWASLEPEITIENVEKPLYGYYRVPLANNIDLDSPLGISVYSPAVDMIRRADEQFSRLDWEYEGGQMAIDVDVTALNATQGYYGTAYSMDRTKNRLYRSLDLGQDDTYKEFAPSLRDTNYMTGLDKYLMRIEDIIGLARGSISEVSAEARTATEIRVLKQRTFITISSHQTALEHALNDTIDAMNVLATLYNLAPEGDYTVNTEWKDSVLTDTQEELNQRLQLLDAGIEGKVELRMWYKGEDEETARLAIEEIEQSNSENMLNDLFTQNTESPLDTNENEEE